jgi:hypothetical protein
VSPRTLGLAWGLLAIFLVGGLIWGLSAWRSVSARAADAAGQRNRLLAEIRQKEDEIVKEMRMHAGLLQDLQLSAAGADPSVFLNRLAELAQGSRMRITAIGPLERQSTAQFSKLWHTVQVTGSYRDIRELATRVERDRGVLEDMVVETRDPGAAANGGELSARFRMTTLELSPEGKRILDRALVAAGKGDQGRPPSLALPLPSRADGVPELRDPFIFGPGVVAARAPGSAGPASGSPPARVQADAGARSVTAPPVESRPETPMELKGIVGFPGGYLAILNNQIVKVGDSVAGHRVERVSEGEVVLKSPEGSTRVVPLPAIGASGAGVAPVPARSAVPAGSVAPPVPGAGPAPARR